MIETNSKFVITVKRIARKLKSIILFLVFVCISLSVLYFMYYIGVKSDDYIIKFTGQYLTPLAAFLNPNTATYEIYRNTAIYLLLFIILLGALNFFINFIEDGLLNLHKKFLEIKENAKTTKEYKNALKKYDDINCYSICLSIDTNQKQLLSALDGRLRTALPNLNINLNRTIVIIDNDFNNYDEVYDSILKVMAKFKKQIKQQRDIELIFSSTTDAHINNSYDIKEIEDKHFKILNFNFKNRASSSALFSKKYGFLDKEKYKGIPVGLFNSTGKNDSESFEINIIYKNLNQILSNL